MAGGGARLASAGIGGGLAVAIALVVCEVEVAAGRAVAAAARAPVAESVELLRAVLELGSPLMTRIATPVIASAATIRPP